MILLDTHALIWWTVGSKRIGPKTRRILQSAASADIAASTITFLELGYLSTRGRFAASQSISDLRREFLAAGAAEIALTGELALRAAEINGVSDPFDRSILATADELRMLLVTADAVMLDWPGRVQRLDPQT